MSANHQKLFLSSLLIACNLTLASSVCLLGKNLPDPPTTKLIEDFLNRDNVKQSEDPIDALICCLPDSYRSNPPYVYKSRSNQKASYQEPRVLLGGAQANPIIAFSGQSDAIEVIEQKEEKGAISVGFSEFQPSKKGSGKVENPDCVRCHGGRQIWDSYFLWPGLYGSIDDSLSPKEEREFKGYVKQQAKTKRYRCLSENGNYFGRNSRFGDELFSRNVERVANALDRSDKIMPFRAALLHQFYCQNSDLTKLAPRTLIERANKKASDYLTDLDKEGGQYTTARLDQIRTLHDGTLPKTRAQVGDILELNNKVHARLRSILELAGEDTSTWSLVRGNIWSFNDGERVFGDKVMASLGRKWLKQFGLSPYNCDELAKKSQERLEALLSELRPKDSLPANPQENNKETHSTDKKPR